MRLIKILGLAMAALVAMSLVGAPSASASGPSALCKVANKSPCPDGDVYTGHIEGKATNPSLLGNFFGFSGSITCEKSVIFGNALGLGSPQLTHLESISFEGNCKTSLGASCIIETETLGLIDFLRTAANLGTAKSLGNEVRALCGGFPKIDCKFVGEPILHATDSSTTPHLTANQASLTTLAGGTNCPTDPLWDALYAITLPQPIFIAS